MNNQIKYLLHLADNNLVLSQRNGEWCGHGPILEQDIAITNITLDLLGQARLIYQHAAELINNNGSNNTTEDSLAYLRHEREYKNVLLVELPNGDWGQTILRQYLFSQFQFLLYNQLLTSTDSSLAAIAEKSLKEIKYHLRWSSEWVIRLADGTAESHNKMIHALNYLWEYTGELFLPAPYESDNLAVLKQQWLTAVTLVFEEATLPLPEEIFMQSGGKQGIHTEHLGYMLADMQYLQRSYPNAQW